MTHEVPLRSSGDGRWTSARLVPPAAGVWRLESANLTVDPPTAFRLWRVYRESDGELLANGGWDQSRTRPVRILPADDRVDSADAVRVEACAWGPGEVQMTGVVTWTR